MKVFILGGTGNIGTAVTRSLVMAGHQVIGLSRSEQSDAKLLALGATPCRGEAMHPAQWAHQLRSVDAVVQLAASFGPDMAREDRRMTEAIIKFAATRERPLRLLYTGGCWLYGTTGKTIATETSQRRPFASFSWMQNSASKLLATPNLSVAVIHPAMVYHQDGGVFSRFVSEARGADPIEIWGSITTHWPLVHRDDLARAYLVLLTAPDLTGHFNVSAEEGRRVGDIVGEIARRYRHDAGYVVRSLKHVLFKYGDWAEGPTLDQRMGSERIRQLCGWTPQHGDFRAADF